VEAARDQLGGRAASIEPCPACEHDGGAVGRALETLLDGLADGSVREHCRELGGLCIPHLRTAAVRGDHRSVAWLPQVMMAAVGTWLPYPGWLAGTDHDADVRAVLRRAAAAGARPVRDACVACLAASRSECDHLAHILRTGGRGQPDRRLLLCAAHLGDIVVAAASGTCGRCWPGRLAASSRPWAGGGGGVLAAPEARRPG
jgi:hypothetical protein